MVRKGRALRLAVLGAILFAGACQDTPESTAPELVPDGISPQDAALLAEGDAGALSRAVPGFGGLFIDEDGTPTVYLTDLNQRAIAERALSAFAKSHGVAASQIRVKQGRFEHARLDHWHNRISPEVLAMPGVVFTDLDEASNSLRIGVEKSVPAAAVRGIAARLGIPEDAVIIEETEPFHFAATLRDRVRPVQGGLQINFSGYLCTLGFNAVRSGVNSFITNSHCTNTQGGTEGTQYYQPSSSTGSSYIGTEVADPTYFTGGACPAGRRCRYSDSARGQYASGVSFALGQIARTTSRGSRSGSLTISGTFNITGKKANPVAGEIVNKIGRTTGWTYGRITSTCANVSVSGTNITQLCQSVVSAGVGGGDSGSNVFYWSGSGSNVTLYGILWGGNTSGTQFIFSPMSGIERELGTLTVN